MYFTAILWKVRTSGNTYLLPQCFLCDHIRVCSPEQDLGQYLTNFRVQQAGAFGIRMGGRPAGLV